MSIVIRKGMSSTGEVELTVVVTGSKSEAAFALAISRATNTWQDMPKEMRDFVDEFRGTKELMATAYHPTA